MAKLPDGEGVISKGAPVGKVIAFYAGLLATGAVVSIGVLVFLGLVTVGGEANAKAPPRERANATLEQKVDRVASELYELRTDVAVIKRQLGLDGLGAPPPVPPQVRTSRMP